MLSVKPSIETENYRWLGCEYAVDGHVVGGHAIDGHAPFCNRLFFSVRRSRKMILRSKHENTRGETTIKAVTSCNTAVFARHTITMSASKVCAVFGYGPGLGAAAARKWGSEGFKVRVVRIWSSILWWTTEEGQYSALCVDFSTSVVSILSWHRWLYCRGRLKRCKRQNQAYPTQKDLPAT